MCLFKEIEKSFPKIEKLFSEFELQHFIDTEYSDLGLYHFGIGTLIRNSLLSNDSKMYVAFVQAGITQKDDMSYLLIRLFYIYQHQKSVWPDAGL